MAVGMAVGISKEKKKVYKENKENFLKNLKKKEEERKKKEIYAVAVGAHFFRLRDPKGLSIQTSAIKHGKGCIDACYDNSTHKVI